MADVQGYEDHDAIGLAALVRSGEVSPAELVEACIRRIEVRDPTYNAVTHRMFDAARAQAAGELPDGPLRGVPYLLKDLHATVAGHPTAGGSRLDRDRVAAGTTTLVQRLLAAGVVLVGKTNTPELGIMGITEPRLFGPSRNPWDPDHTPGGSSGGSGAAVAARYVPAAHASDGGGSIRIPAAHCGLVGLKPTRARTPTGPHDGDGWGGLSVEHALTRTVRDTALLLDVVRGPEAGAAYQVRPPERPYADEVGRDPGRLRIARIDQAVLAGQNAPECLDAVGVAARVLAGLGHDIEEAEPALDRDALRRAYFAFVCSGIAVDVDEIAARAGAPPRAKDFEPTTWMMRLVGRALGASDVEQARRDAHRAGFDVARFFETHDLLLLPTTARAPARVGELYPDAGKERLMTVARWVGTRGVLTRALDGMAEEALSATPNTQLANLLGLPAISLPLHMHQGLPIGVQLVAPFGREDVLLRVAAQLEQASPWADRRPELAPV